MQKLSQKDLKNRGEIVKDIDYQKVVDDLDRQDFNVMEDRIEELIELINTLTKRIEKLESTVKFHEQVRRR